ncbi:MAG: hypothetical protein P8Y36_11280, partial [Alphaproteobacteria bacterium]
SGIETIDADTFRVITRIVSSNGDTPVAVTLRLTRSQAESHQAYTPLLMRFLDGEDFENRTVRSFDSGRIRNELQTLCSDALEFHENTIRVHYDRIQSSVISPEKQRELRAATVLIKHFTHLLPQSPNPESALLHFRLLSESAPV